MLIFILVQKERLARTKLPEAPFYQGFLATLSLSEGTAQIPSPPPPMLWLFDGLMADGLIFKASAAATQKETANCPLGRSHHLTPQPGSWDRWGSLGPLGRCVVLEEGRQEESHGAQHTHNYEHPQEQPVDHHGHVLPVLHDILVLIVTLHMLRDEADAL